MIDKKDVTIIIPTLYNQRNNFARKECLKSLEESGFPMNNIIVVQNNFGEGQEIIIGESGIILFSQGQCKAVNAAVATVNTKWTMVSNDDQIYPPDWFERLTEKKISNTMIGNFDVNCVSPILIEPRDGAPTFKKYFCGGVGGDWDKQKFMDYAEDYSGPGLRPGFNTPFLIKKEIWDLIGGYDINYDPWGSNSDSDLEYKLKLAGIKMWQNTNCPVYHFSNTSDTFHPRNRNYWEKNYKYFIDKWGFERVDSPEIWTTEFAIPYEKLKYRPSWAKLPQDEAISG